jgi:hypothetical protein
LPLAGFCAILWKASTHIGKEILAVFTDGEQGIILAIVHSAGKGGSYGWQGRLLYLLVAGHADDAGIGYGGVFVAYRLATPGTDRASLALTTVRDEKTDYQLTLTGHQIISLR